MLHKIVFALTVIIVLYSEVGRGDQGMSVVAPEEILAEDSHTIGREKFPVANQSGTTPGQNVQYLLTRQGFVWEGIIEPGDKTLYVRLPDQRGGVTISRLDVLCIATCKEELFEYRKSQINQADASEIIKLADWGVRHQLTLPAIAMIQAAAETAEPSVRDMLNKKAAQLQFIEKIRLDSLKHKKALVPANQSQEKERHVEQLRKIEQWGRKIPLSVQDRFLKKIQPVLFRHCSSEDCHRESNQELDFVLYQSVMKSSKRVNSLKNLRSVLARIDLASPQTSRILNHPPVKDRHGKTCYPFGNTHDSLKDYETFVAWISGLAGYLSPEEVRSAAEDLSLPSLPQGIAGETVPASEPTKNDGNEQIPVNPMATVPPSTPQASPVIQTSTGLTADGEKFLNSQRQAQDEQKRRLGAPVVTGPKDAFDPILFNRRYHPEKFK